MQSQIGMLGSNAFKPLIHMIRPVLPYTHSLRVLRLYFSPSTYLWPYAFLFHEFFVRETPTLTLRWHHLEFHIGEVHIVSFSMRHISSVLNFIKSLNKNSTLILKVNIITKYSTNIQINDLLPIES